MCIKKAKDWGWNSEVTSNLERVIIDKLKFSLSHKVSSEILREINISSYIEQISNDIVLRVEGFLFSKTHKETIVFDTVKVPVDWWEAVKERFFPMFLILRYPIKYRTIQTVIKNNITRTCPHLNIASSREHVEFLITKEHECKCLK